MAIDRNNRDKLWQDSIELEMKDVFVAFTEYTDNVKKSIGDKEITGHLVFDVKLGENL